MHVVERTLLANGLWHHAIAWNDAAPGPTLVCCHGFLDLAWSFAPLAERVAAAGLRVVAFDWRGHGETEHVGAGGYYHFPDYVLDLHELLPQLAEGPVHLLGHSMGGTACCYYAGTHPGSLATLSLLEGLGPPAFEASPVDKLRAWLDSVERLARRPVRGLADLDDAVRRMRAQNPELDETIARFLAEKSTVRTEDGLRWRFDPLHRTTGPMPFDGARFRAFLQAIRCPTLVVWGERSPMRPSDATERLGLIAEAREAILPGAAHNLHHERPDELAAVLTGFFARSA